MLTMSARARRWKSLGAVNSIAVASPEAHSGWRREFSLDRVPESRKRVASRLIILATSLVGGPSRVLDYMQCSESDFLAYCAERKPLPRPELERLVELIILEQPKIIGKNREIFLQIRARLEELDGL